MTPRQRTADVTIFNKFSVGLTLPNVFELPFHSFSELKHHSNGIVSC